MVTIRGLVEAQAAIEKIEKGMRQMEGTRVLIGSRYPYAFGIEEGYHEKSSTLARSAGGARMLANALQEVLNDADPDITQGMNVVRAPGPWIVRRMALWVRRLARKATPRGTGMRHPQYRLWKSIKMFTIRGL